MLGVVENPFVTPADQVMQQVADDMGVADSYQQAPVGVFFGQEGLAPGTAVADPYFGGVGPTRNTCIQCGECMVGCRHNAKNTLVKNYLYLAEQNGARVHPLTTVTRVVPRAGGGYEVHARWTRAKLRRWSATRVFTAHQVGFSAGAIGTQNLLHKLKTTGDLPAISDRLGDLTRTNSEAILGAIAPDLSIDYSHGVAITSSIHPDESTHFEPVRYGKGSNAMSLLQTVLTDGGPDRKKRWLREMWKERSNLPGLYDVRHWSERMVVLLVMQALDNSITVFPKKTPFGWRLSSRQGHGEPNPVWIPGRQPRCPLDGEGHVERVGEGVCRRHHRRAVQRPDDGPLHRRLHHRGLTQDRCGRPLPTALWVRRPARRGRVDHLGQPGRQPVADDRRPGGASHGVLAQQGPQGPEAAAGVDLPACPTCRATAPERPGDRSGLPPAAPCRHQPPATRSAADNNS
jgi:ferredoxin